jgi:hypothetical protein
MEAYARCSVQDDPYLVSSSRQDMMELMEGAQSSTEPLKRDIDQTTTTLGGQMLISRLQSYPHRSVNKS